MSSAANAAETRGYVVSWFGQAANSYDGDCPDGITPVSDALIRQELRGLDYFSASKAEEIASTFSSSQQTVLEWAFRGRHNGKHMNVYTYPTTVPDIGLNPIKGKYAYGFNLDGKGASSPNGFEDPETHEKGVNNEYWRAMGCNVNHRGSPKEEPSRWTYYWSTARLNQPAWLVTITTDDFNKDGDVVVKLQRAFERVSADANGNVRADSTFRVDPDPRWQNVLKGKLKDGIVTVTEPTNVHMLGDPLGVAEMDIFESRLRIKIQADGSLEGVIGGYVPWRNIYYFYASSGTQEELMLGTNVPGSYYALKKHADAYPDPKTGENTAISSAFRIAAVPAFLLSPQAKN